LLEARPAGMLRGAHTGIIPLPRPVYSMEAPICPATEVIARALAFLNENYYYYR
jgi:hypothetical protein